MLRERFESCPYCNADVRGMVRCAGCREALPGCFAPVNGGPPHITREQDEWLARVVMGVGFAGAVTMVAAPVALPFVLGAGAVGGVATLGLIAAESLRDQRRVTEERTEAAPFGESRASIERAIATLRSEPSGAATVGVLGRVSLEFPCEGEAPDVAAAGSSSGRFWILTESGAALVDDYSVECARAIRDGDEVTVVGRARLTDRARPGGYRGEREPVIAFDAVDVPLLIRPMKTSPALPPSAG